MSKKIYLVLLAVALTLVFAVSSFAAEVTVGADLEIDYLVNSTTDTGATETDDAGFNFGDADLNIDITVDANTSARIKVDLDDDGQQLEEANITLKNVADQPISLRIGKQEVPFGMDKQNSISDHLTHNSGSSLSGLANFGEVDQKMGITLTTTVGDTPKIELCTFEDTTAAGANDAADEPGDTGLFQSVAVRVTSTRVAGLTAKLSGIVMHSEGLGDTPGMSDNADALSLGLDYTMDKVNVFLEAIWGNDLAHVSDANQSIYHLGVVLDAAENIAVALEYSRATYEDGTDAGGPEPELSKFSITPTYTMASGVTLAAEYTNETLDLDTGADDVTIDAILLQIGLSI